MGDGGIERPMNPFAGLDLGRDLSLQFSQEGLSTSQKCLTRIQYEERQTSNESILLKLHNDICCLI
jgi:hypothetical protein